MKAFLASLLVLAVVSVAAYVILEGMEMTSSSTYSSNSVRLN